jgi:hypothetical protein
MTVYKNLVKFAETSPSLRYTSAPGSILFLSPSPLTVSATPERQQKEKDRESGQIPELSEDEKRRAKR